MVTITIDHISQLIALEAHVHYAEPPPPGRDPFVAVRRSSPVLLSAPHGAICGRLLPHVMAVNVRALQERMPGSEALHRYDEVAQILTGSPRATAADGVAWVQELCDALRVGSLKKYGVTPADLPTLIEKGAVASSMQGNPIRLTPDEMKEILTRAL